MSGSRLTNKLSSRTRAKIAGSLKSLRGLKRKDLEREGPKTQTKMLWKLSYGRIRMTRSKQKSLSKNNPVSINLRLAKLIIFFKMTKSPNQHESQMDRKMR